MKIIDKTPLLDEKGQLSIINRVQGMLKYGMTWPAELEAQSRVIAQLDRVLEKGFVLIRNFTLPNSEVVIPIILLGPNGVTVMQVTTAKGFFEAKGDQWNTIVNGRPQPARVNLLTRVSRLARALQVYMERQRIELAAAVEAVLITADPGAHVDSMRPIARVVMSDAIKQFGTAMVQARPVWRSDMAFSLADQIVEPRPVQDASPIQSTPVAQPSTGPARAQAIFNASEQAKPFNANDLGFAFADEESGEFSSLAGENDQTVQAARPPRSGGKMLGLSTSQLLIIGVLGLCECIIVAGFAAFFLTNQ